MPTSTEVFVIEQQELRFEQTTKTALSRRVGVVESKHKSDRRGHGRRVFLPQMPAKDPDQMFAHTQASLIIADAFRSLVDPQSERPTRPGNVN